MPRRSLNDPTREYQLDEEDPSETYELSSLLSDDDNKETTSRASASPPIPTSQIVVILLLYVSSPVSVMLSTPFMVQRIGNLGIAPAEVGYYLGLLDSLSYAGEALMVFQWGRLSDKFGRKPILLTCTLGLTSTLIGLGFAGTYSQLAVLRAFEGLFNGNSGVMKAILAELAGDDEIQLARVFSLLPMGWAVGGAIGPPMGGSLANPAERFPKVFTANLWKSYPYLLPCLSGVCFRVLGFMGILLYLKETLRPSNKTIVRLPSGDDSDETLLSPSPSSTPMKTASRPSSTSLLNRRLIFVLLNYAFLAFLDSSLYAVWPLLLASPIESGGLGFSPPTIGTLTGIASFCHGITQAVFFARILKRWDAKNVFIASIISYMLVYALMPVANVFARRAGRVTPFVWGLVILVEIFMFASYSAYSCIYIFLSQAAPTKAALGKTHGLGQTIASIVGTMGPAVATSLVAVSLQYNLLGGAMGYLLLVSVGFVLLSVCSFLVPSRYGSVSATA
ncbi:MFS general substrate transporter [Athelia psychrophila]|uniref:MFS general substrate transporter n=1 Tax=Athelia psychrophila TaxID=1759441 RepID=A0A166CJD5_9AGAM|nr:MFS general substrate transporter [Fibularhizoctonia sp. CBS 109695]